MSDAAGVAVVGAGLGGLATGVLLREAGRDCLVLERAARAGGRVRTSRLDDGTLLEHGPLGWLDREPATAELCALLGVQPVPAEDVQRNRMLWQDGRLHALPRGPWSLLRNSVMPARGGLRLLAEPFVRRRDPAAGEESVDAFARRRFGPAVADHIFRPLVAGIYGGDPGRLSVQAAFPRMAGWEAEHGSCLRGALAFMHERKRARRRSGVRNTGKLVGPTGGMQELTDAMAARLGDACRTGSAVARARREDGRWHLYDDAGRPVAEAATLVVATPTATAAALLRDQAPELHAAGQQACSPLAVVHLLLRREQVAGDLRSFGFLSLPGHGMRALGVQYASSVFPGHTAPGLVQLRVLLGGVHDPGVLDLDDAEMQAAAWEPLREPLRLSGAPLRAAVTRLPRAIPQYDLGHLALRETFERAAERLGGLRFAGDGLHGVGVNAVVRRAREIAREQAGH